MVKLLRENVFVRGILTALRIWIGVEWIHASLTKIGSSVWTGSQAGIAVEGFLRSAVAQSTGTHPNVQAWYASFIRQFALPHARLFSYAVSFGELLVGVALVLGCFTTFAALMTLGMNMAYLLAGTTSTNPNMVIWEMFLLIGGFNAAYVGLDFFIIPRLRRFTTHFQPKGGSDSRHVGKVSA
ncbi:hypothetical protein Heshes_13270 [Alicyclobacillus hesperidum]|uniref:Thiosulfate dehydrogenase [quinone] large subunit n=2 Tax=Alicyclobacillus hesperidum TaxID=89784 RepID=A0AA37X4U5_9BACL|nr:DoxX family protein [Alicyclobacillus hesperidum]GLV13643.1 hypothetical protein Heshes_13270 [Alicyclobacillus hesperidum]